MRSRLIRWLPATVLAALGGSIVAAGCLPTRPEGDTRKITDREDPGPDGGGPLMFQDAGDPNNADAPGTDPHGLSTLTPSHGPFAGGTRVVIQGSGFSYQPRVWFGNVEATDVLAASSSKLQVTVPPGLPGPVDIAVQNSSDSSTRRTLPAAFTYDDLYVDPSQGPTSGGSILTLTGSGTRWASGGSTQSTVNIGQKACGAVSVKSDTQITCIAPPSTPGAQPVSVTSPDGTVDTILDAYTYADTDNGFRGGLSGAPLAGSLRVLAFDGYTGDPLEGAIAILGSDLSRTKTVDANGVALFQGASLTSPVTVTVAHKCSSPTTFVAVGVDTVTMYLDSVSTPECVHMSMMGDIPPTGGIPGNPAMIGGSLVFPPDSEFKQVGWTTVPATVNANERRVAYVFVASADPRSMFTLPDGKTAVTELDGDGFGYTFSMPSAPVGNQTLYAIAGIEDRTQNPPLFTAYAFGAAKGVSTLPGEMTSDVTVPVDLTLDTQISIHLAPPPPGDHGPDRVVSSVAVSLGAAGYAIFPNAQRTTFLPFEGDLTYSGLPPLTGSVVDGSYVVSAQAGDGQQLALPISVIGKYASKDPSQKIILDQFVELPELKTPVAGMTWDDSTFVVTFAKGGFSPDLLVFDVESAGGLVGWTIASPGNIPSFAVPDLRKLPGMGLQPGAITIQVAAARIDDFDYHLLRYRHLATRGWNAYAEDLFYATLSP